MTPTLQFILFIAGFIVFLLSFIRLIQLAEKRFNGKIARRSQSLVEALIILGILGGVVLMFQPFTVSLFEPGFLLLLASTLAFTLWSHIIPRLSTSETRSGQDKT